MAKNLKQRLLQDIAELQSKPYPNIELYVQDDDITQACLVLKVEGYGPMHLTVDFPNNFPLSPPRIKMDSDVSHPNIFGDYICASILNTTEGYTPAYTLKGIAIQLLSFFSSDRIEQSGGGYSVDITRHRDMHSHILDDSTHTCRKCGFGMPEIRNGRTVNRSSMSASSSSSSTPPPPVSEDVDEVHWPSAQKSNAISRARRLKPRMGKENALGQLPNDQVTPTPAPNSKAAAVAKPPQGIQDMKIPDEVLLLICENLEYEDLMSFAQAWQEVGTTITKFDVIRTRELQCFCFKKNYLSARLGVGVSIIPRGRIGSFESEFDLLSHEGFKDHRIRRSVQGVEFEYWLGLPISNGHWRKVRDNVAATLLILSKDANMGLMNSSQVVFGFMNDVVVKLNKQTSEATFRAPYYPYEETPKSTLTHASEKAIESYFHLFHLLLCLATEHPSIVRAANETLTAFGKGETSKKACPSLGHLLVAALISDVEMTDKMIKAIIKETITRNVVWMLDKKGSNMPELAYIEPAPVSEYRLKKTFEASKTSYRLLMFLNLFRRVAVGSPRKSLAQLRDEAFDRHGAPPRGSAKGLANSIKRIHEVATFPDFLVHMGIPRPPADWFCDLLKECMKASVDKGYSCTAINQGRALSLRLLKEPDVEVAPNVVPLHVNVHGLSFFPNRGGRGDGGGYTGARGGRGNWRGRY